MVEHLTNHSNPGCSHKQDRVIARLLQGKEKEWAAVVEKDRPLQLLDLPVDILKEIVNHVSHTNDLTSLALTHSALHGLAIPQIYSRFDIVWPDSQATVDSRAGVDALTFGLATLVMAPDVFGELPSQRVSSPHFHTCSHCGHLDRCTPPSLPGRIERSGHQDMDGPRKSLNLFTKQNLRRIRRGNHFAEYTRKFSLGNGPADWVQEYQINKESGKMLGTLVAMAVGRMKNLESFIWDMPTGVLRDVWLALGSLGERNDRQECRLEKVWVRWHDNSDVPQVPFINNAVSANPILLTPTSTSTYQSARFQIPPYPRVEFPTFSILPPLRSLTVLDIDELPYVEEMSVLLERSVYILRELRIGIAQHAQAEAWVTPAEELTLRASTEELAHHQRSRPGGVLGLLVSQFCDVSTESASNKAAADQLSPKTMSTPSLIHFQSPSLSSKGGQSWKDEASEYEETSIENLSLSLAKQQLDELPKNHNLQTTSNLCIDPFPPDDSFATPKAIPIRKTEKLRLEVLELERVPISIPVLSRAIDWPRLKSLTILECGYSDQLWKALRRRFTPARRQSSTSLANSNELDTPRRYSEDYPLKISQLHADNVSNSLIAFIRETLPPDSLEWLFLQEGRSYKAIVAIELLQRAVRRHRTSLRKLLIESESKTDDGTPGPLASWKQWMFNRDMLGFVTSRLPNLRELGFALDHKDWHFFLQRLPQIRHLRSLFLPCVIEHARSDSRELALQILDIVALRPELELCYLGIHTKCFEILEYSGKVGFGGDGASGFGGAAINDPTDSGETSNQPNSLSTNQNDSQEDTDSEFASSHGGETDSEEEAFNTQPKRQFKLREILFYDDKVSIFKARHGKL